jgi:hypothetical protein
MMTSFIPLLIVTSLYAVFIEVMEYDDTFHTFYHCDLTVKFSRISLLNSGDSVLSGGL